jgi:AraC family ethanolamine operon transcriptional activator
VKIDTTQTRKPEKTSVFSLQSRDFMEMQQVWDGWDHRYDQISPGAFRGSIHYTQTGSLEISRNRWERAIHYRGVAPEGSIGLALSMVQSGEARWMGQPVAFDDLILQRCGMAAEYLSAPLWDSVVFAIPEAELAQQIADITHDDPWDIIVHGRIRLIPQVAAQLRQAAMVYLETAARSLARPELTSILQKMAGCMVEQVASALVSSKPLRDEKASLNRQRRLIKSAEEYVAELAEQPLRIGRLCRELDICDRTLHHTVHNLTGMSPLAYFKTGQLNRVHHVLRDADPTKTLVKQAAMARGFNHVGQFSRDYKQLFGELPSETLRRC